MWLEERAHNPENERRRWREKEFSGHQLRKKSLAYLWD